MSIFSFRYKVLLSIVVIAITHSTLNAQIRILTIGDSTMANYDEEKNSGEKEMRGWAQMLPFFVKDNVRVDNAAKNGRSSKSFHIEFWNDLKETLKPGDYLFIQFGHNDEKNKGLDDEIGSPKRRGTAAWGQYQQYLTTYVNDARERGATPILLTPVVRRLFENDTIVGIGRHSLTELAPDDSTMNYPKAMRALAHKLSVPLVDMTELTKQLVEGMGAEKAKEVIYANNDNTHLKAMGGILFSKLAVEDLLRQGILTDYLTLSTGISIKPASYDFRLQLTGKQAFKSFTLSGLDLNPAEGQIKISVEYPFLVSLSPKEDFSKEIVVSYKNGYIYSPIYVQFESHNVGKFTQRMNISSNNKAIQNIQLSAEAISTNGTTPFDITCINKGSNSSIKRSDNNIKLQLELEGIKYVQTDSATLVSTINDEWPAGDIDMDASRYVGFTVDFPKNKNILISSIKLDMSSVGTRNMRFTALCSTDPSFTNPESLAIMESISNGKTFDFDKIINISGSNKLYIRLYPWHNGATKDKYIWIKGLDISGFLIPE